MKPLHLLFLGAFSVSSRQNPAYFLYAPWVASLKLCLLCFSGRSYFKGNLTEHPSKEPAQSASALKVPDRCFDPSIFAGRPLCRRYGAFMSLIQPYPTRSQQNPDAVIRVATSVWRCLIHAKCGLSAGSLRADLGCYNGHRINGASSRQESSDHTAPCAMRGLCLWRLYADAVRCQPDERHRQVA